MIETVSSARLPQTSVVDRQQGQNVKAEAKPAAAEERSVGRGSRNEVTRAQQSQNLEAAQRAAAKAKADANTEDSNSSTRVSLSHSSEPQPKTADRNARPIEQFKAVSALR